jgi:hypothetical protein
MEKAMTGWFGSTIAASCTNRSFRSQCRYWLVTLVAVAGLCSHADAQTITSISPTSALAGGPGFTLTVTGSGYIATSVVQVNGNNRSTVFVSALQLTATIFASDIATPGVLTITVFNPVRGGGLTSNPVNFTAAALPGPVLTSVSPGFSTLGTDRVRITLVGSNFRPGATVVISPPLAAVGNSNGHTRAGDITVLGVTVVSPGVMTALFSVSPAATLGLRAVDVLNLDGSNTANSTFTAPSGSSQPLRLEPSNSLGAPLSVFNMALTHPRDGTVVMQGDELNAQAVLGGTGTGTVVGQWLWDGNVVEQFTAVIVGGQSKAIQTRQSLPTWSLGAHTLLLRMTEPNQVTSRPIVVVVNPGDWKLEQLILPAFGAAFATDDPPRLLWAPVPGAMKYQVGFSTEPHLSAVETWFDSVDNRCQVPADVWGSLPEGELYWTVRAVDTSGQPRQPLPLRSIYREPAGSLAPPQPAPSRTPAGHTLLEWKPVAKSSLYFVTISSDLVATHIVRRYLTADPKLDLRAAERQLLPGTTYYWQVDAIASDGRLILSGPVERFVAQAMPQSKLSPPPSAVLLASLARPGSLPALPAAAVPAGDIAGQTPAADSSTSQLQPLISATFPQPVNPGDVSLMVDDIDVTTLAQVTQDKVSFTPPLALTGGDHNVNLTVGSEATTWKFTAGAPAPSTTPAPLQPGTDAEAPPTIPATMPAPAAIAAAHQAQSQTSAKRTGPAEDGQIAVNTQWASGSDPPDSNVISVAEHMTYEDGPWHVEVNGSGLLNSILNPEAQRTSQGKVNDYILQVGDKGGSWGVNLRFGIVTPTLYTDAQFVTAATPRQGVELALKTPAGTLSGFTNTNDVALGGGAGINFHQRILGASWQAPLPEWAVFRLMWLSAEDIGAPTTVGYDSMGNPIILPNPIAPKSAGDVYGSLLNIHLFKKWLWSSEYAFSRDNANTTDPTSTREFGRAWRTGVSGNPGKTNVNVAYRDVSANFGNPANPSLTQDSQPDLRGVDAAVAQTTGKVGTFGVTYSFLANNVRPTTSDELFLHSFDETWTRPFGASTNVVLDARQSLTKTGTVPASLQGLPPEQTGAQDMRDISGNLILSRQIGKVTMSGGATRDWSHNTLFPATNTITSSVNGGTNLVTSGFFQLNAQVNVNWVAADGATVGTTRTITVYVQPAFVWKKPAVQVSPLITFTQGRTLLSNGTLTSDMLTGQYGGRFTWTLPGFMKFNTLSAQGSYNQNQDNVTGINQPSTQLLVLWTATWGHKRTL